MTRELAANNVFAPYGRLATLIECSSGKRRVPPL
jgi:hypothetical protein